MPNVFPFDFPFKEAITWFKAKKIVTRAEFDKMDEVLKARAFTAAYVFSGDLLEEVFKATLEGVEIGQSYHEFSHRVENILLGKWHRETVFRTNTLAAFGLGHFQNAIKQAGTRPYVRYTAIMDARTREAHARLHGATFRMNDPQVKDIWPPIGYNCRCLMYTLTEEEAQGLDIKKVSDPDIPGPDQGFSSPTHGGFFNPKVGGWSDWVGAQVQAELEALPEFDPKARYATTEIPETEYTPTKVPGIKQIEIPEEDLAHLPKKAAVKTIDEYLPELEVKPVYTTTKVPEAKYYTKSGKALDIPGIKQITIAEEDLVASWFGPPNGLTSAEWEHVRIQAKKKALSWWKKQPTYTPLESFTLYEQKLIEDLTQQALTKKASGGSILPKPKAKVPKELEGIVNLDEWKNVEKQVLQKVKSFGFAEDSQAYKDALEVWTTNAIEKVKAHKLAGEPIPGYKPKLTAKELKELDEISLHYAKEKIKAVYGDLDWDDLPLPTQEQYLKTAKDQLKQGWLEQKKLGNLDDHIKQIKANLAGEAQATTAALEIEAKAWAQKHIDEYLAEWPSGAQPTASFLNDYKKKLVEAYIKKGGIPSEMLSADAAVGISTAADPMAPKNWKTFLSRKPAHDWGLNTFSAWRRALSSGEYDAIYAYKGSGYIPINNELRIGASSRSHGGRSIKDLIADIDKGLAKAKLPEPIKVFRGCSFKTFYEYGVTKKEDLGRLVGSIVSDKGYPSCGLTERSAWAHKGILWEMRCPAGTPGAYLEAVWNRGEYEVLLGRGLKYKVLSVDLNYSWGGRIVPKVVSEVIL